MDMMSHAENTTAEATATPGFTLPESVTMETVESVAAAIRQLPLEKSDIFMLNAASTQAITTPGVQLVLAAAKTVESRGGLFLIIQPQAAFTQSFKDLGLGGWLKQREASNG